MLNQRELGNIHLHVVHITRLLIAHVLEQICQFSTLSIRAAILLEFSLAIDAQRCVRKCLQTGKWDIRIADFTVPVFAFTHLL